MRNIELKTNWWVQLRLWWYSLWHKPTQTSGTFLDQEEMCILEERANPEQPVVLGKMRVDFPLYKRPEGEEPTSLDTPEFAELNAAMKALENEKAPK